MSGEWWRHRMNLLSTDRGTLGDARRIGSLLCPVAL